jgi:hypothetical protein
VCVLQRRRTTPKDCPEDGPEVEKQERPPGQPREEVKQERLKMKLTLEEAQEQLNKFVDAAKENLVASKDHTLIPAAIIAIGEELLVVGMPWRDHEEKRFMTQKCSDLCKERDADGVVLIVDGHYKKIATPKEEADKYLGGYRPGQLAKEGAPEAIIATWIGPRVPNGLGVIQPYRKENGKVVWEEPIPMQPGTVEANVFPSWWNA